jgi:EpsI family protein
MRRAGFKPAGADANAEIETTPVRPSRVHPWAVAGVTVVASIAVYLAVARLDARPPRSMTGVRLQGDGVSPVELPEFVGTEWVGRSVAVTAVERTVLPADTGYSRRNYVSIGDTGRQVFVSIVLSGRDRTSIHRPELCLVGQGWTIAGRLRHEFLASGEVVPVTLLRIEHAMVDPRLGPGVVHSLLAYWFVGGDALEPTHAGMQLRDAYDRLRYLRADRWAYVVVQTVVLHGDEAEALAHMQEVLGGVWPVIRSARVGSK